MSGVSRWLNWTPSEPRVIGDSPKIELTKLTKADSVSFVSASPRENHIIRDVETGPARPHNGCPYHLPERVRLIGYTPRKPPIAVTVCSVVMDLPKFIQHALAELDARLHSPIQIRAGDSVFELLSKLSDCGLELRLEWPPEAETFEESAEHGEDVTDEDTPL
jgi:hypothetical protein